MTSQNEELDYSIPRGRTLAEGLCDFFTERAIANMYGALVILKSSVDLKTNKQRVTLDLEPVASIEDMNTFLDNNLTPDDYEDDYFDVFTNSREWELLCYVPKTMEDHPFFDKIDDYMHRFATQTPAQTPDPETSFSDFETELHNEFNRTKARYLSVYMDDKECVFTPVYGRKQEKQTRRNKKHFRNIDTEAFLQSPAENPLSFYLAWNDIGEEQHRNTFSILDKFIRNQIDLSKRPAFLRPFYSLFQKLNLGL